LRFWPNNRDNIEYSNIFWQTD